MKRMSLMLMVLVFFTANVYSYGGSHGKDKKHCFKVEDKFFKKACLIFKNQDELGVTDEQMEKLKDLKYDTKKLVVLKDAEIKVIALDIKRELWRDIINAKLINKLIDKKYDIKKIKAKALVQSYADLKNLLTEEQKNKMKELCKLAKKEKGATYCLVDKKQCSMIGKTRKCAVSCLIDKKDCPMMSKK